MPSSTSSSNPGVVHGGTFGLRPILIVLAVVVGVFLLFETFARVGVHRISTYVGRNRKEMLEAIALRPGKDRPTVLVAGTSLLLEGIDFPELRKLLSDKWDVHRWVMEQSTYTDWYFGLRKLFAEGGRPDAVVLMMGPTNVVRTVVRGDYFARKMLLTSDWFEASRRLDLHPTEAANLLAANLSEFYGLKTELRKTLLIRLMPDMMKLTAMIIRFDRPPLDPNYVRYRGQERMREMRQVVNAAGSQYIFAIPPRPTPGRPSTILREAGAVEGVPVIVSVPQGELGYSYYRDGNHLLPHGAAIYTQRFAPDLRKTLEEMGVTAKSGQSAAR